MCGIAGCWEASGINSDLNGFLKSIEIVSHRGPDGYGIACFQTGSDPVQCIQSNLDHIRIPEEQVTLALGHRRLAIIDLSGNGAQPMSTKDRAIWITYNGEIYNYIELRNELISLGHAFSSTSDTEVVLAAYSEWGESCVGRFNGIWAFAIADFKRKKMFCSRDRFGVKPFYYFHDGKRFVFGSEIKQLLCYSFVPQCINRRSVYEYLAYGAVDYCEETFWEQIFKLMQGNNITVDLKTGYLSKTFYYRPRLEKNTGVGYEEAAKEFRRLLSDSVRLQLRSDVEVGSCLSGGLDSSSIVSLVRQELLKSGKGNIQRTFSSHFEEDEANELNYMRDIIDSTGVNAEFIYPCEDELLRDLNQLVWHQDEPFGSTSIFAQWSVFKRVHQKQVKVMLDGQGADEMLAGYVGFYNYYFKQLRRQKRYLTLYRESRKYANLNGEPWIKMPFAQVKGLLRRIGFMHSGPAPLSGVEWLNPDLAEEYNGQSIYQKTISMTPFGPEEILENVLYQMTFFSNLQSLLRYEDRNSMAYSVEARVPYLDHRLVEFVLSLPSSFKIRDGYTKRVLRDGMEGVIPEGIRWRVRKLGFATPEKKWLRDALKPAIEATIQDEQMNPYINTEQAARYYDHLQRHDVADSTPWRWVNLLLWMRAYKLS